MPDRAGRGREGRGREGGAGAGAHGPVVVDDPADPRLADYQALRTRGDRTPG